MKTLVNIVRCAIAIGLVCSISAPAAADIPIVEREVLLELYRSTHGSDWIDNTDWNGEPGSECDWFGVRCNVDGNHVQSIILERNFLSGPLPSRLNQLKSLIHFSAKGNELTGPIPSLSGMQSLKYFDVSENQLTGAVPDFSGLAWMTSFHAAHNLLSGPLPHLTDLPMLEFLEVGYNRMTGPIPSLNALTHLKMVDLRSNQLSGPVPDMKGATGLLELDFSDNQLTGGLPAPPAILMRASLCPNPLDHASKDPRIDAAWSTLTRDKPWWLKCTPK